MSVETLLSSIEEYKVQLDQIEIALQSACNDDRIKLQELQLNLLEILELTLKQLQQLQNQATPTPTPSNENAAPFEDEMLLFQAEIAELENKEKIEDQNDSSDSDEMSSSEDDAAMKEAEKWEGKEFRAPFTENWGGFTYHNVIVLSYVPVDPNIPGHDSPQVRVLFRQPTRREMLPCQYFLDSCCKFSDDSCHFSHGNLVETSHLKEYKQPDLENIKTGDKVLSMHAKKLWHQCAVEDILDDRSSFSLRCDECKKVVEATLDQIIPLEELKAEPQHEMQTEQQDDMARDDETLDETIEETIFVPTNVWFKNSSDQRLGQWEEYTKGIGSKLMQKMGYIVGTGLGPEGVGRVDPVEAFVYPPGVSLDRCMELREASGGKDMLSVEKKLLKEKKKIEQRQKRNESMLKNNTSVFEIINEKLVGKASKSDCASEVSQKMDVSKKVLLKDSVQNLNKKSYQIDSRIQVVKKELLKLNKTRSRHADDKEVTKSLDAKINVKTNELKSLKEAERKVFSEQKYRKDTKVQCKF